MDSAISLGWNIFAETYFPLEILYIIIAPLLSTTTWCVSEKKFTELVFKTTDLESEILYVPIVEMREILLLPFISLR